MDHYDGNRSLIDYMGSPYLTISQDTGKLLLYAEFNYSYLVINGSPDCLPLERIAKTGVEENGYSDSPRLDYMGRGSALFRIGFDYHRGPVGKDCCFEDSRPMQIFRKETGLDLDDPAIVSLAAELSRKSGDSAYEKASLAARWMADNIHMSPVPQPVLEQMIEIIRKEPSYNRNARDVVYRLADSLTVEDANPQHIAYVKDRLRSAASRAKLDRDGWYDHEEAAKKIFRSIGGANDALWMLGSFTSARKVLEYGSGQCIGLSNLYTSICRNMDLSAKGVSGIQFGYVGGSPGHRWSAVDIGVGKWVEHDPSTGYGFGQFESDCYAYPIEDTSGSLPWLTVFGDGSRPSKEKLESAIRLLREDDADHMQDLAFLYTLA